MSAANRAQASAASEQQHNQENVLTRLRGPLKGRDLSNQENQENQPLKQATNRTVLGVLHNNQRIQTQNQRATKQVGLANDASPAHSTGGDCCQDVPLLSVLEATALWDV